MKTIMLKHANFSELSFPDGSMQLIGSVRCDSFREIDIPKNPNPRHFTGHENPNYKRMISTLLNEPEMFIRKNASGITIFASSYKLTNEGIKLTLSKDDGIANGGHTYEAVKTMGTSSAYVKVTIEVGLSKEHILEVAESLNLAKRIQSTSLENKRGKFDLVKSILSDYNENIMYFEGDSGIIDIREILSAAAAFSFDMKTGELDPIVNFKRCGESNQRIINKFTKELEVLQLENIFVDAYLLNQYIITNRTYLDMIRLSKKTGLRRRFKNGEWGVVKFIAYGLLVSLAYVGTELDENKQVKWKQGFNTHYLRCAFIDEMFTKLFYIIILEEYPSKAVRDSEIIKKIVRQAEFVASTRKTSEQLHLV